MTPPTGPAHDPARAPLPDATGGDAAPRETAAATALIAYVHAPITALGPGLRAGVWFQGCTIHCPGCVSTDTWGFDEARRVAVDEVAAWIESLGAGITGVTITGGEPFDQPEALAALATRLRAIGGGRLDVLCYSGYELARLRADFPGVLALLDAIAAGPYRRDEPSADPLLGSGNQQLVPLTELGAQRFARRAEPAMDLAVTDGVWLAGVPRDGDLAALAERLARRGVRLRQTSWRATGGES